MTDTDVEPETDVAGEKEDKEDEQQPPPMNEQIRSLVGRRRQRSQDALELMLSRRDDAA